MRTASRLSLFCCAIAAAVAAGAAAQAQQVYRYVDKDGRVVYTDRTPPADSKNVQAKRFTPNFIESDTGSLATMQAQERFPVTVIQRSPAASSARTRKRCSIVAASRSRPSTSRNRRARTAAEAYRRAAGAGAAGRRQARKWRLQRTLERDARRSGYPKALPLRRATPVRTPADRPAAPATAPQPARADAPPPAAAAPGGGYPKD
jgi:hypothetical protein